MLLPFLVPCVLLEQPPTENLETSIYTGISSKKYPTLDLDPRLGHDAPRWDLLRHQAAGKQALHPDHLDELDEKMSPVLTAMWSREVIW